MDTIEKNELKQVVKAEFDAIIKENMTTVLKKHNVSPFLTERIIKDLLVWSNMVIDSDLS